VRAEVAVESARRKAVLCELELQRGDVPADQPAPQRARAERVPAEAAESQPCPSPGKAVDREAGTPLKAPDGLGGLRPGDPVDRARVEAVCVQADLKRRDAGAPGGEAGCGEGRGEEDERQGENTSRPHGSSCFGGPPRPPVRTSDEVACHNR
jgi:hypothetical protein